MISTRGRYAIRVLIDIAENDNGSYIPLKDIAATVPCPRAGECETLPMWAEYDKLTHDFFHSKWLSDLVRK